MMHQTPEQGKQQLHQDEDETKVEAMRKTLEKVRTSIPGELCFENDQGNILTAFVNADRAWLMYRVDDDDAGYSSRNPTYTGPEEAVLPYILDNGQRDEYPVSWTLPIDEVIRATEYFLETGEKAPWVTWHDDYFPQEHVQKNGKLLDILANGDRAWLRYRRYEQDPGFTSRSTENSGLEEEVYTFIRDSGQQVAYPTSWTISKEKASRVYGYFLRTGERAPGIEWHDNTLENQ
jgi:hypothetical protein